MKRALDIAIVGYGIAGIAAAINLRRSGHRIVHFERNDPPAAGGAGMLLHPAALHELDRLGVCAAAIECGAPVRRICAQTVSGCSLMDFRYSDAVDGQYGLGIQRGTLHRLLASADSERTRVLSGRQVISVDPAVGWLTDERGVRHGPFDLVVIADGAHSLLRGQLVDATRHTQQTPSAALVGLLDDPQRRAGDRLVQYFESSRHLSVWPVGSADVGAPLRCALAINVTHAEAENIHDEQRQRALLTGLHPALRALLNDDFEKASLRVFTYRDVELAHPCVGRVAIIGDAAHSMSPQLGTGAQLAMQDAAALAGAVDRHDDIAGALRDFMRIRAPQIRRHQLASRWLTPLVQSDSRALASLRDHPLASAMISSLATRTARVLFRAEGSRH